MEATELIALGAAELIARTVAELIAAVVAQEAAELIAIAAQHSTQNGPEGDTSMAVARGMDSAPLREVLPPLDLAARVETGRTRNRSGPSDHRDALGALFGVQQRAAEAKKPTRLV